MTDIEGEAFRRTSGAIMAYCHTHLRYIVNEAKSVYGANFLILCEDAGAIEPTVSALWDLIDEPVRMGNIILFTNRSRIFVHHRGHSPDNLLFLRFKASII